MAGLHVLEVLGACFYTFTTRKMDDTRARNWLCVNWFYNLILTCFILLFLGLCVNYAPHLGTLARALFLYDSFAWETLPRCCVIFHDVSIAVTNGIHLAKEGNDSLVPVHKIDLIGAYYETTRPLVHDPKHDYLYVSGTIQHNGTVVYRIDLASGNQEKLIITDSNTTSKMEGKILGIEHDYVNNVLFWSNGHGGKILKVNLDENPKQQVMVYDRTIPNLITSGLTLDECSQTLYWTSYVIRDGIGFIESSNVDGSNHITLHHSNLCNPTDITIDQTARKLYWCDMRDDASFMIERSNLDGSFREVLIEGTGTQPSSIALTNQYIYWINIDSAKFERIEKFTKRSRQDKILDYEADKPRSIVAHKTIQKCGNDNTMVQIKPFPNDSSSGEGKRSGMPELIEKISYEVTVNADVCLNNGQLETTNPNTPLGDIKCKCPPNFYGQFCEKCDYCVNGKCNLVSKRSIQCSCDKGYNGSRCEHDVCFNFCLNGGTCNIENQTEPTCDCRSATGNYQGLRCEIDCNLFCQNNPNFDIYESGKPVCSCGKNGLYVVNSSANATVSLNADEKSSNTEKQLRFGLIGVVVLCILLILVLMYLGLTVRKLRQRPRIKKRIIVNKNVTPTPLTSRPSPGGEQCEITIENCCNMNICETPCYEPQLRTSDRSVSKTEEKKNLLGNMEEGERGSPSQDTLY